MKKYEFSKLRQLTILLKIIVILIGFALSFLIYLSTPSLQHHSIGMPPVLFFILLTTFLLLGSIEFNIIIRLSINTLYIYNPNQNEDMKIEFKDINAIRLEHIVIKTVLSINTLYRHVRIPIKKIENYKQFLQELIDATKNNEEIKTDYRVIEMMNGRK